ncbi:MAG TPA: efflux RND transporter periplasmic adaptor subunit, partial [Acidobacteriota bacterium]|nr:efflux RND transporter periplasmic adaptor subunit [Acidobacteriota bacterium]
MKRNAYVTIPAVAAMVIALVSCKPAKKGAAQAPAAEQAAVVKTYTVARQRVSEKIAYSGTLEASKKTSITPEIGGKIARILVREGDSVKAGQVLAELETESIRLQLKQAEAGLAVAEAGYKDALKNKERMDRLIKENAVSEQQAEKVTLGYDAARAQREQAQAALNLAKYALNITIMKAPFAGIIAAKNAEVGDVINPMMGGYSGASGVLTLMDFAKVKIAIDVAENDALRLRKGQAALLRVPSFPDREFPGEVTIANLTADAATKKFRVEALFDNAGGELRPGTFGEVVFEASAHESVLAVPQKAVLDNSYVYVVQAGKAVKRTVTLGLQNTTVVEVLSGLAEGDVVI